MACRKTGEWRTMSIPGKPIIGELTGALIETARTFTTKKKAEAEIISYIETRKKRKPIKITVCIDYNPEERPINEVAKNEPLYLEC